MRKKLKIEISGSVATGKSSFAAALFDLCIKHGIPCSVEEGIAGGDDFEAVAQDYEKRLDTLGGWEVIEVEVVTILTRRSTLEILDELGYKKENGYKKE